MDVILACQLLPYEKDNGVTMLCHNWMVNDWIPYTENKNLWNVHTALDTNCIYTFVHGLCVDYPDTVGLFEMGHGQADWIQGDNLYMVWSKYDPRSDEIANLVVYFLSCSTGQILGPWLVSHGAKGWIGYNDLVWVGSGLGWKETLGEPWIALCDGETLYDAYQRTFDLSIYWYTQTNNSYILANCQALVYFGDPLAKLLTEPAPICSWLAENTVSIENIFVLIDSFLDSIPPTGYSFIPSIREIFGVIDYYLGYTQAGNVKTDCNL